jgi:folate-dependent phosphoribosylglycinamide formyltransferase PurN
MSGMLSTTTDRRALDDGDVITPDTLASLHALPPVSHATMQSSPAQPQSEPQRPPLLLARPSHADRSAREQARAWLVANADRFDADSDAENALLHAFETAAVTRPPLSVRAENIDADLARLYLTLSRHWIATTTACGDPRYLNAALKILALCLLTGHAPALAHTALTDALDTLDNLSVPHAPHPPPAPASEIMKLQHPHAARVTVFAGRGSRGLALFRAAAQAAHLQLTGVLLHDPGQSALPATSAYAEAWYPAPHHTGQRAAPQTVPARTPPTITIGHRDWAAAAEQMRRWKTDLLVLLGMDIVPEAVLQAASLGTINAHNGALPAYRGMDAIGWTLLAGDPPTCSVHYALPEPDAGAVLSEQTLPADSPNLRQAVKDTQTKLLIHTCRTLAETGALPPARPQNGPARRFYRMHPALRRLLDQRTRPTLDGPEGASP